MGERPMRECLAERLAVLHATITGLQSWYDEGADECDLYTHASEKAWAYLEGAADMADLTVQELLWAHGLSFAKDPKGPEHVYATIVLRDVGAGTGRRMERAFYDADDGSHWAIPPDHERTARRKAGQRVLIAIHSRDDQYAYPVTI